MIKWNLKTVAIKDLKEMPKNPRQIDKDKFQHLSNLIAKYGVLDNPIVNADMTIIGGHQRIKVLKKAKVKTVECKVFEEQLSDEDIDELCIGLNLYQGKWDYDIMADLWDPVQLFNYGFSEDQLMGTFGDEEEKEKKAAAKKKKSCPACGHEF